MAPTFNEEKSLIAKGYRYIAGVDEVGRGPVAGPIVAAAVIMDPATVQIEGVNDSKKLTHLRRVALRELILANALSWAVGEVSSEEIDRLGISRANDLALKRAIRGLEPAADFVLADFFRLELDVPSRAFVKGDQNIYSVACASIVAKVYRDNLMVKAALEYPGYGFEEHKGYLTKKHLEAILENGPCDIHRQSFWPIKELKA